jgi:hypothetical protein
LPKSLPKLFQNFSKFDRFLEFRNSMGLRRGMEIPKLQRKLEAFLMGLEARFPAEV